MIALNEIIKNKDYFSNKYKLMGKNCNLEKIIKLEKKFIALDQRKNKKRALCNKLCAQMADLINKNNDTEQLIKEINFLDKQLMVDERKSTHAMKKINKLLAKLPNPALNNNILNISLKTTPNKNFSEKTLKLELAKIAENNQISNTQIKSIKSLKNRVLQKENLPKFLLHNRKINNEEITILMSDSPEPGFEQITSLLKNNACSVIDKSTSNNMSVNTS